MVQFVTSVTHAIYHRTRNKIYRIYEGGHWLEVSQEELAEQLYQYQGSGEKYMIVYDYQIMNKRDLWDASPEKINKEELSFWHLYGLITEEQYLHYITLSNSL